MKSSGMQQPSRAVLVAVPTLLVACATLASAHAAERTADGVRVAERIMLDPAHGDSAAVAATVDAFHRALVTGDSVAALALLTVDAQVLEAGGIETLQEYRAHHLPADIAFAGAVPSERGPVRVTVRGDVAWAVSASTSRGEFRGRPVNAAGAELMVLVRETEGWRIAAIHWSSRTLRD